jgi:hypothetical protein
VSDLRGGGGGGEEEEEALIDFGPMGFATRDPLTSI